MRTTFYEIKELRKQLLVVKNSIELDRDNLHLWRNELESIERELKFILGKHNTSLNESNFIE